MDTIAQQEKDRIVVARLEIIWDMVLTGDNPNLRNLIADVLDTRSKWNIDDVRYRISRLQK